MLVDFTIENYRSYKDKTTFSMIAEDPTFKEENVETVELAEEKLRLLKFAGIFGANASGKSNVIYALETMKNMVLDSYHNNQYDKIDTYDPYLFDDYDKKPTYLGITFISRRHLYKYDFRYNRSQIYDEHLYVKEKGEYKPLFAIDNKDGQRFLSIPDYAPNLQRVMNRLMDSINDTDGYYISSRYRLFLSHSYRITGTEAMPAALFFKEMNVFPIHSVINLDVSTLLTENIFRRSSLDRRVLTQLIRLMNLGDLGIDLVDLQRYNKDDFHFPNGISEEDQKNFVRQHLWGVRFEHVSVGDDNKSKKSFDIKNESTGSKRLFSVGYRVLSTLNIGGLLALDEMNLAIHPDLFKFLVRMFTHRVANAHHAQLIFTTHDTAIAGEGFMRSDQMWFSEKRKDGTSDFFAAKDFDGVKIDTPIEAWYRVGRFGARPNLDDMEIIDKIFDKPKDKDKADGKDKRMTTILSLYARTQRLRQIISKIFANTFVSLGLN